MANSNFYRPPQNSEFINKQADGITYNEKNSDFINKVSTGVAYSPSDFIYVKGGS